MSALFVAVVCGGVDTQTTPSPIGPVVWLLNWSDRLKGRSRHSRSHYSTLLYTHTRRVCVCLQFSVISVDPRDTCFVCLQCGSGIVVRCTDLLVPVF